MKKQTANKGTTKNKQYNNIEIIKIERIEYYKTYSLYHMYDKRLTISDVGFLDKLFALPNNWKITTKATSKFLGISEPTFINYIKKLKNYGYIETRKNNKNQTIYTIKERPCNITFDYTKVKNYTLEQLTMFLNDETIPIKYHFLILKHLKNAINSHIDMMKTTLSLEEYKEIESQIDKSYQKDNNGEIINTNDDDFLPFD